MREAAERFGEAPAFIEVGDDGSTLAEVTYAGLERRSDALAAGLARRGVRPGDVVALVLPPGVAYLLAYVAAAKLGAITAGINTRLTETERQELLALLRPSVIVGDGGIAPWSLEERLPLPPIVEDDDARVVAIVLTSGTTGRPRGAVFTGRQLATIAQIEAGDTWGGGGRSMAATTFAHLGFMTKLPGTLQRGGTTYVTPTWRARVALALIERLRLDVVAGVPTQLALLLARPELAATDLSSVRLVVTGGGPSTPELIRRARATFDAPVVVRYSCTEAGIGTGTQPTDPPEDAEETVGRSLPGVDVAIREGVLAVQPGEVGEVLLRSSAVMEGYWRDDAATEEVLTSDGFARTGDRGWVDPAGRLHLVGRTSEMYVRGGFNVHPVEVEAVLSSHPAVEQLAVVGVDDEVMGQVGVAFVVPRADQPTPTLEELHALAEDRLAAYKLPQRVVELDRMPLTAGEKIDRAALRALVG